jgi:6,7-dimethyl-8-ribityllumazine synthase
VAAGKGTIPDAVAPPGTSIGIAVARFNDDITSQLLAGARAALEGRVADVKEVWAPGAFELPLIAQHLLAAGCDAVVALGCVIRGDTGHYDFVAGECATGLQRVQLDTGKPVIFGVLTTENHEQAVERAAVDRMNKGGEAVDTAIEMLQTLATIKD